MEILTFFVMLQTSCGTIRKKKRVTLQTSCSTGRVNLLSHKKDTNPDFWASRELQSPRRWCSSHFPYWFPKFWSRQFFLHIFLLLKRMLHLGVSHCICCFGTDTNPTCGSNLDPLVICSGGCSNRWTMKSISISTSLQQHFLGCVNKHIWAG